MGKSRFKKGDLLVVISGNDKGKEGTLLSITGDRAIIQGVNIRKKHSKGRGGEAGKGKIVSIEAPVSLANVGYAHLGKAVKLRSRFNGENKKEIYYKAKQEMETVVRVI